MTEGGFAVSRTAVHVPNVQYAALPWRRTAGAIEILLITTRNTKSWIVPKGWPLDGRTPSECAAHEALEEAGVLGEMAPEALGTFRYNKRRKSGEMVPCEVHVFTMEVVRQRRSWAEKAARDICWCSLEEALARVTEPSLRRLIAKFGKMSGRWLNHRVSDRIAAATTS
jgi:8-oxo-dGTP pyrophosphatase MutT (NUDIX family)